MLKILHTKFLWGKQHSFVNMGLYFGLRN